MYVRHFSPRLSFDCRHLYAVQPFNSIRRESGLQLRFDSFLMMEQPQQCKAMLRESERSPSFNSSMMRTAQVSPQADIAGIHAGVPVSVARPLIVLRRLPYGCINANENHVCRNSRRQRGCSADDRSTCRTGTRKIL